MEPSEPPKSLPLFPLTDVVLYPRTSVPLFVFEPRYRAMVEDAVEGEQRIGMIAVVPGHEDAMAGDPPVYAVGCEGRIVQSARRPDGTWEIVLTATARFRILEEPARPADRLYRIARIERLDDGDDQTDRARIADLREHVIEHLSDLLERVAPEEARRKSMANLEKIDDPGLVNALCQGLGFGLLEKQPLLEADSTRERYELLDELIRFRLGELDHHGGASPDMVQ